MKPLKLIFYTILVLMISCTTEDTSITEPEMLMEEASGIKELMGAKGMGFISENPGLGKEISRLRKVLANIRSLDDARAAGWDVRGTDFYPGMGYHYLNLEYLMDGEIIIDKPEAILIACGANGELVAVGVEYLLPAAPTDPAPEGFTGDADVWSFNFTDNLWTLHAWVKKPNPAGFFNPTSPLIPDSDECSEIIPD